jgi:hypothetical protein
VETTLWITNQDYITSPEWLQKGIQMTRFIQWKDYPELARVECVDGEGQYLGEVIGLPWGFLWATKDGSYGNTLTKEEAQSALIAALPEEPKPAPDVFTKARETMVGLWDGTVQWETSVAYNNPDSPDSILFRAVVVGNRASMLAHLSKDFVTIMKLGPFSDEWREIIKCWQPYLEFMTAEERETHGLAWEVVAMRQFMIILRDHVVEQSGGFVHVVMPIDVTSSSKTT